MRAGPAIVLSILGVSIAAAQPEPDEPKGAEPRLIAPPPKAAAEPELWHYKQAMASVRFGLGLRAIATYEEDTYCGDTDSSTVTGFAPVCTGRAPFSIDFELGYGVARKIDAFLELRVGVEQDFDFNPVGNDGPRALHLSPGARFFFSESRGAKTKLFTTAQVVLDVAGYRTTGGELGADFGLRNMSGIWIDLERAYGFYAYVGETATFTRWLRFELEAGIGVSARYP